MIDELPRTTVTARIKVSVRNALLQAANKDNISASHVVERALVAWLTSHGAQLPADLAET